MSNTKYLFPNIPYISHNDVYKDAYCIVFDGTGHHVIVFEGIATLSNVFLNREKLFSSESMYISHTVDVELTGKNEIEIHCSHSGSLNKKYPRARWRQQLADDSQLRNVRHTFLGHMPGWAPTADIVGPYRPIKLIPVTNEPKIISCNAFVNYKAMYAFPGKYFITLETDIAYECGEHFPLIFPQLPFELYDYEDNIFITESGYKFECKFHIREEDLDWPKWTIDSNNNKKLPISLKVDDAIIKDIIHIGFRTAVCSGPGHQMVLNDSYLFCRGAIWSNINVQTLQGKEEEYRRLLKQVKDAGMNMLRISGNMCYESSLFYDLCDEYGIMIWQDFMFANFDYPRTEEFTKLVETEVTQFLKRTRHNVCIVVLCGGSEVYQQASMLGLEADRYEHPLFIDTLRGLSQKYRPDVLYIENSPFGNSTKISEAVSVLNRTEPFNTKYGITHYFGVGAYLRDFSDIRRSDVKFATECLALANVPCAETVAVMNVPSVHHPVWKEGVSRDNSASWDFEDVRDHYLQQLFKVEPNFLRRQDPIKYLELSRAVSYYLIKEVFSEWRSSHSQCNGGIVLQLQDAKRGAGWGLIDSNGLPKAAYHAFKQVNQKVQVVVTDEGLNGIDIHTINETTEDIECMINVRCFKDGRLIDIAQKHITLNSMKTETNSSSDIFGRFIDITYAYRFGPPQIDVVLVELISNNSVLSQASYYPHKRLLDDVDLKAILIKSENEWILKVSANRFAQLVHVNCNGFQAEDDWVDIAPDSNWQTKLVRIANNMTSEHIPDGYVIAINSKTTKIIREDNDAD